MLGMFPGLILASINRCLLVFYKLFLLSTLKIFKVCLTILGHYVLKG